MESVSSSAKHATSSDLILGRKGVGEFVTGALVSSLCTRVIVTE